MASPVEVILALALVLGGGKRRRKQVQTRGPDAPPVIPKEPDDPGPQKCEDPFGFSWESNEGPVEMLEPPVPWPWDGFTISDGVEFPIEGLSPADMDSISAVQEALYAGTWRTPVPALQTFETARKYKPGLQWWEFGALHLFNGWTMNERGFVAYPCTDEEVAVYNRLKTLVLQTSNAPKWVDLA